MKERWNEARKFLEEQEHITRLDLVLALLIALTTGVIIGYLTNPKRPRFIGSFNGNFNGNYGADEGDADAAEEADCSGNGETDK